MRIQRPNIAANRCGFTLIEAVISSVIVATMLVAALNALGSATRAARIQADRCLGPNLARQLMAEIVQNCYREPDRRPAFGVESPESTRSRAAWDDVDDYDRWSASPPQAKDGGDLTHADGWTRSVRVRYVEPADPGRTTGTDKGLKRITVTATSSEGKTYSLTALRSEASIYDYQPAEPTTILSYVGVELQIGSFDQTRVSSGTNIFNPIPVSP